MRTAHRRETMIALMAARSAIHVARDIGYPQIDVADFCCEECQTTLNWQEVPGYPYEITCPVCGKINELPFHLRRPSTPPQPAGETFAYANDAWPRRRYTMPFSLRTALIFCIISVITLTAVLLSSKITLLRVIRWLTH